MTLLSGGVALELNKQAVARRSRGSGKRPSRRINWRNCRGDNRLLRRPMSRRSAATPYRAPGLLHFLLPLLLLLLVLIVIINISLQQQQQIEVLLLLPLIMMILLLQTTPTNVPTTHQHSGCCCCCCCHCLILQ